MANENPDIGAGDVEIELDGKTFYLRPTLDACMALSRFAGRDGMATLIDRCLRHEFDVITMIVAHGIGVSPQTKDLPSIVFKTGLFNVVPPLITFLNNLANGGAPLVLRDDAGGDDEAPLDLKSVSPTITEGSSASPPAGSGGGRKQRSKPT